MSDTPRLLFVADPAAAVAVLEAVRAGGPVRAQLAPTADVLRQTLAAPDTAAAWAGVVYVPGAEVEEVELAVYVPDGLRLFVVADEVPLLLAETAAEALPEAALGTLAARLADAAPPAAEAVAQNSGEQGLPSFAEVPVLPQPSAPAPSVEGEVPESEPRPSMGQEERRPDPQPGSQPHVPPPSAEPEPHAEVPYTPPTFAPLGWGDPSASPASASADSAPEASSPAPDWGSPFASSPLSPADVSGPFGGQTMDPSEFADALPTPPPSESRSMEDAPASMAAAELLPAAPPAPSAPPPAETRGGAMTAALASLADHLPIGLYRTDVEGRILYANPALQTLLGTDADLAALDVRTDLGYPREAFEAEMAAHGEARNLVVTWTRPDGARVHTRENARSLRDADGQVVAYEGTLEDVTAEVERQREERARAREHRAVAAFAAAAALADDPATIHCAAAGALLDATEADWAALLTRDAEGRVVAAASAGDLPEGLVALIDRTPAVRESVFPSGLTAVASVELDAPAPAVEALVSLGVGALASVPVERAGRRFGALAWGRAERTTPRATEGRAAEAMAWHVGGHLERAAARRALRDTEATLAVVAEHTPHVLYRLRYTDAGPVTDYLSPAIERLTGYGRGEIEARGGLAAFIESREACEGDGLLEGPVEGAERYRAICRLATAHGVRWVEDVARPWRDAAGRPVGLVGVLSDVTEQHAREAALAAQAQEALARQRALVDLAGLEGADAYGAAAAGIVAATLGAAAVSFWTVTEGGTCVPLFAPPAARLGASPAPAVEHVASHRALAVADAAVDPRVHSLGLGSFVRAHGLTALLVAPVRREGRVAGLVAIHRTDGPHEWSPGEAEFAGAVADAVALAFERDDRELALAALEEAREIAEAGRAGADRADRLTSAFLETLSHEVRTPLTDILGYADLLAAEAPAAHREPAARIARNGRRLLGTFDAVLELSRLEAGEVAFETRRTVLAEPVRTAAAPFAGAARDKGLRFDLDLDEAVAADLDGDALGRLVGPLIKNAVAYTADGGVHVSVEADGAEAVVRVADTGRGIAPAFLAEAAAPFRQEAPTAGGAGLGLALARRLAEALGGRFEIASEQPGGTVVTVAFPLAALPQAPAQAAAQADVPVAGDGQPGAPSNPGDLLGQPFDFTFLNGPTTPDAVGAAPARSPDSPPPAPSDMFAFSFGRSKASDPDPAPAAQAERQPPVAASPPPTPRAPERPAAARPSEAPAAPPVSAPPAEEPVMFVRPREGAPRPTIPQVPAPQLEEAEVVDDGRPPILVVEDNDDTRMLLDRILRSTYAVTAVGDARSALLAMNERRYAGLVLDINLGGKETGADVLRIARSLPDYGGVFAVALTAYALPGDRERLLESGFNAYISKPFTRSSLMETLAEGVTA